MSRKGISAEGVVPEFKEQFPGDMFESMERSYFFRRTIYKLKFPLEDQLKEIKDDLYAFRTNQYERQDYLNRAQRAAESSTYSYRWLPGADNSREIWMDKAKVKEDEIKKLLEPLYLITQRSYEATVISLILTDIEPLVSIQREFAERLVGSSEKIVEIDMLSNLGSKNQERQSVVSFENRDGKDIVVVYPEILLDLYTHPELVLADVFIASAKMLNSMNGSEISEEEVVRTVLVEEGIKQIFLLAKDSKFLNSSERPPMPDLPEHYKLAMDKKAA